MRKVEKELYKKLDLLVACQASEVLKEINVLQFLIWYSWQRENLMTGEEDDKL
jgi:hypothetical protein